MPTLQMQLYRLTHLDGSAKDWVVCVHQGEVWVAYGKTGSRLRMEAIQREARAAIARERKIKEKLAKGYRHLGLAEIRDGQLRLLAAPPPAQSPASAADPAAPLMTWRVRDPPAGRWLEALVALLRGALALDASLVTLGGGALRRVQFQEAPGTTQVLVEVQADPFMVSAPVCAGYRGVLVLLWLARQYGGVLRTVTSVVDPGELGSDAPHLQFQGVARSDIEAAARRLGLFGPPLRLSDLDFESTFF
jgi:predicted DNA-binding WGR domain protein